MGLCLCGWLSQGRVCAMLCLVSQLYVYIIYVLCCRVCCCVMFCVHSESHLPAGIVLSDALIMLSRQQHYRFTLSELLFTAVMTHWLSFHICCLLTWLFLCCLLWLRFNHRILLPFVCTVCPFWEF